MMRAVVLSFDMLSADLLGCYGNESIRTPNIDRFATTSTVFDQHFGENFSVNARNHSWWTGRHAFPLEVSRQPADSYLFDQLQADGVVTSLLQEQGGHVPSPQIRAEKDRIPAKATAISRAETTFESLVQQGMDLIETQLESASPRSLLWLKACGVSASEWPGDNEPSSGQFDVLVPARRHLFSNRKHRSRIGDVEEESCRIGFG